jgi:hypothetical protein
MANKRCHRLDDLVNDWQPLAVAPQDEMPGMVLIRRHRAHTAFRLEDEKWHLFRYRDQRKADEWDSELQGQLLP